MEKIVAFLSDLASMNVDQRKNLINKLNNDPIHGQKFGKFLILAIDRLEFIDKAIYLARACKFYEREDITQSLLVKVKGIIEKVELNDLKRLGCTDNSGQLEYFGYPHKFDSMGLYLFQSLDLVLFEHTANDFNEYRQLEVSGLASNTSKPQSPRLTDLGKILIHIIKDQPLDIFLKRSAVKIN